MDWIEDNLEKWREKLRDLSLSKALVYYMLLAIIITILAIGFTWQFCSSWMGVIRKVNGIEEEYIYAGNGDFIVYDSDDEIRIIEDDKIKEVNKWDEQMYEILETIQVICIPVYSVLAIILVALLYYRNKLREPMHLLKMEMDSIARNDLSFSCRYDSADEMGDICRAMDEMRCVMVRNQQLMWNLMEEQRRINAAFAHDIRTPLTVIDGYVELLLDYYPKGTISQEQLLSTLKSIKGQTQRMKDFSHTMKEVQGFEMLEVKRERHTREDLQIEISNIAKGLEAESGLTIVVNAKLNVTELYYDENVITEVLGNLLSNALRYGKEQIQIRLEQQDKKLYLYVKDDGRGMTKEELYRADSPYYSDKSKNPASKEKDAIHKNVHFGLGLTICKILCQKHGGGIGFSNSIEGGAIVCAEFYVG